MVLTKRAERGLLPFALFEVFHRLNSATAYQLLQLGHCLFLLENEDYRIVLGLLLDWLEFILPEHIDVEVAGSEVCKQSTHIVFLYRGFAYPADGELLSVDVIQDPDEITTSDEGRSDHEQSQLGRLRGHDQIHWRDDLLRLLRLLFILGANNASLSCRNFLCEQEVPFNQTFGEILTHKECIVKAIACVEAAHGVLSHVRVFRVLIADNTLDFANSMTSRYKSLYHGLWLPIFLSERVKEDLLDVGLVLWQQFYVILEVVLVDKL